MGKIKNIINQKFGRLEVIAFRGRDKNVTYWECKCNCGSIGLYRSNQLISGKTKSCGCLVSDTSRKGLQR